MLKEFFPSSYYEITDYNIVFYRDSGSGFSFPCDENKKLLPDLTDAAKKNYEWCMAHPEEFPFWFNGLEKFTRHIRECPQGVCECGERLVLWDEYLGACECPRCKRWYNLFGQELNHPSTWRDGDDW